MYESRSVVSDSLRPHGLYSPVNSPGQNTGVGSLFLQQGIFPTQGQNPGLLHCRQILYQLSYKGSPTLYKLKLIGIYLIESVIQKQDCNPNVFPKNSAILLFLLFSWPNHSACGTLFPQPEIETAPHALEAWSLNHWTAREVPKNGMK